jgi:ferredoxin
VTSGVGRDAVGPGTAPRHARRRDLLLRVDPIACDGRGICAELLPEMIVMDDWGFPIVDGKPVPSELLSLAKKAAAACPTLALHLVREDG